ncbi:MAG: AtpZ/AtpI family protein [Deltaproteobacteria bacterium]|nr:AtpZ/AtpI family protein [Deltaproteobacteria bacterium]
MSGARERFRERGGKVWAGARYASVGLEFGLSVVIGYLAGAWLEGRYGFAPWGSLGGVVLGFAAAVRSLLRLAAHEERSRAARAPDEP